MLSNDGKLEPTTESATPPVEISIAKGAKQRAALKIRKYRGLRKPRSSDPELWAIYNEVHGKGQREKRRSHRLPDPIV